jgi:hypothetical protein
MPYSPNSSSSSSADRPCRRRERRRSLGSRLRVRRPPGLREREEKGRCRWLPLSYGERDRRRREEEEEEEEEEDMFRRRSIHARSIIF